MCFEDILLELKEHFLSEELRVKSEKSKCHEDILLELKEL